MLLEQTTANLKSDENLDLDFDDIFDMFF